MTFWVWQPHWSKPIGSGFGDQFCDFCGALTLPYICFAEKAANVETAEKAGRKRRMRRKRPLLFDRVLVEL